MEFVLIFVVLSIITVVLTVLACGEQAKCPACGKWGALTLVERKPIDCQAGVKLVTRTDVVTDQLGNVVQVWRQQLVKVLRVTYDALFRCQYCGQQVRKPLQEESECG
jgi:hypothetical protein